MCALPPHPPPPALFVGMRQRDVAPTSAKRHCVHREVAVLKDAPRTLIAETAQGTAAQEPQQRNPSATHPDAFSYFSHVPTGLNAFGEIDAMRPEDMGKFRDMPPGSNMCTPFEGVRLVRILGAEDTMRWRQYICDDHSHKRFTWRGINRNEKRMMAPADEEYEEWHTRYAGLLSAFEVALASAGALEGRRVINVRVLTSVPPCKAQELHTDYPLADRGRSSGSRPPAGALLSMDMGTTLDLFLPSEGWTERGSPTYRRTRLWIPPGWAAVFEGYVLHAGSAYNKRLHHRVHAYLDATDCGDWGSHLVVNGVGYGTHPDTEAFEDEGPVNGLRRTHTTNLKEDRKNPVSSDELKAMWREALSYRVAG